MNNKNNTGNIANTSDATSATSSTITLGTSECGNNHSENGFNDYAVANAVQHDLHYITQEQYQQQQLLPLLGQQQQLQELDNAATTSIMIEENTTGGQPSENTSVLGRMNESNANNGNNTRRGNLMGQYARYFRQQMAEVTMGGLSSLMGGVSRSANASARQNASGGPTPPLQAPRQLERTDNRVRYIPTGASFGRRVTAPSPSAIHFNVGTATDEVRITLSDNALEVASRTGPPPRIIGSFAEQDLTETRLVFEREQQRSTSRHIDLNGASTATSVSQSASTAPAAVGYNASNIGSSRRAILLDSSTDDTSNADDIDNNTTYYSEIFVATLRQCLHYIPFVCILLFKFIYDHLSGLLDIIFLQFVMYYISKSLQAQIARLDEKKNTILLRDLAIVVLTVSLRLLVSSATPEPFGLLIAPPLEERNIIHKLAINLLQNDTKQTAAGIAATYQNNYFTTPAPTATPQQTTIVIRKVISLAAIIYYLAVNDLILKLLTTGVKLIVTLIPLRVIRYKSRTRLYVFIEFFSQFYRSIVPIHQWLIYLFESSSGIDAISGAVFSAPYFVLKGCELADRGKSLKKSFLNMLRDRARKPVQQDDLNADDELCAICQDLYVSPVVLECGHIFCDNCVSTWFRREQTCPMCRAKVGDILAWHDGSTTYFYQLY